MTNTGRTENLKPWKPGQSGNPGGKAIGTRNRSTIVRQWLESPATDDGGGEVVDQITRALIQKAVKGDVSAFRELMDSAFGKITDHSMNQISYNISPGIKINGVEKVYNIGKNAK